MTVKELLAIKKPGDLYSFDEKKRKEEYKKLIKEYHPDDIEDKKTKTKQEQKEAFEQVVKLYQQAQELAKKGRWEKTNYIRLQKTDGKSVECFYLTSWNFELGTCYVCRRHILYLIDSDKKKFYEKAISLLSHLPYQDTLLKKEFAPFFPKLADFYETMDGFLGIVLEKETEVYPLNCLIDYFDGKIPVKHIAWIISRLSNLACYFNIHKLVHNGITIHNCFVSPKNHTIYLYGGWWYMAEEGEHLTGITKEIYELMPIKAKTEQFAAIITDLESIKQLGRKLCGEANINKFRCLDFVPDGMKDFLTAGSSEDAIEEFEKWEIALKQSFGPRKFIPLSVTETEIYQIRRNFYGNGNMDK